ncbi:MAG TPA: LysE family translocator [Caulobacteraceae bacterium]|jgi:threonine/homoserine/homoserine lactone efflux protein|nr:LysE family translocator [Caulobacteraceae bacterium]
MNLPADPARYAAFLGVMAAMAFFPGPANLFCVATGMARGRRAALAAMIGMNCATLVWYGAASLGLDALISAFPDAFRLLRLLSAAYLMWMAVGAVKEGLAGQVPPAAVRPPAPGAALRSGFLVQIANPKVLLFFTAVLPPFVDLARALRPQLVLFAVATIGLDAAAMTAFGLGGAAFAGWMERPRFRRSFSLAVAALLAGAAVLVALSGLGR